MIYVDELKPYFRNRRLRIAAHLMADTTEELRAFAKLLGLPRSYRHGDHYDIYGLRRHTKALDLGAKLVSSRQLVKLRQSKKKDK